MLLSGILFVLGAARATIDADAPWQTTETVNLPILGLRNLFGLPTPDGRWRESNDGLTSWSFVGLQAVGEGAGSVNALTRSHGLFRSDDAGRSWQADNAGLPPRPNVSMGHTHGNLLTADPNNVAVLYTNFGGRAYKYRRGIGWIDIGNGIDVCDGSGVVGIVVDPQDSNHIFAAHIVSGCPGGIYEAWNADADEDITWTHLASWTGAGAMENDAWTLAIDPDDSQRMFSAPPYLGFLYSTNGGAYWRRDTPLGGGRRAANIVVVHPEDTNRVILGHPGGIHVGEHVVNGDVLDWTWTDHTAATSGYVWDIDVAPTDPDRVLVASTPGLFGSSDGGNTWYSVGAHGERFVKAVAFDAADANTVYVGSGSGMYRSDDGGRTLNDITGTIPPEMEVQATAISRSDARVYYCNLYGVAFCRSANRGVSWDCRSNDPGVTRTISIEVAPADPNIVYAGLERVYRSQDGGRTWVPALDPGTGRQFFDIAAGDDGAVYAVAVHTISSDDRHAELYRSQDAGDTWSGPVEAFGHPSVAVGPIVLAPDGVVYVASYDYVRRSTDAGTTWTRLSSGLSGHRDDKWVDGLAVDAVDPTRLYLTARSHRLFASQDGGGSWGLLDAEAPPYPGRILIDRDDHSRFYVFGLNGWRRYDGFGKVSEDLPTTGIHATYTNFRRTAQQDPLDTDRFVAGDQFQGFLVFESSPDAVDDIEAGRAR